ncbi:MAG: hypothetical protein ACRC1D_04150, partial [Culicoidibacterales bacterium]
GSSSGGDSSRMITQSVNYEEGIAPVDTFDDMMNSTTIKPVSMHKLKADFGLNSENVSRETLPPQVNLNISDVKLSGVDDIQQFARQLAKEFEREMSLCI